MLKKEIYFSGNFIHQEINIYNFYLSENINSDKKKQIPGF